MQCDCDGPGGISGANELATTAECRCLTLYSLVVQGRCSLSGMVLNFDVELALVYVIH